MTRFTGKEGRFVGRTEAQSLTGAYRQRKHEQGIADALCIQSEFFGVDNLRQLLNQPGCVGIRVCHAKRWEDTNGNPTTLGQGQLVPRVVLVGIDAEGNELDLIPDVANSLKDMPNEGGGSQLADGPVCPPHCSGNQDT